MFCDSMTEQLYLSIGKLDNETLVWVRTVIFWTRGKVMPLNVSVMDRDVAFHGRKDGAVAQ